MPEVFVGSRTYPAHAPGPVVTVGNFDGVHRGHRALIARAAQLASIHGVASCAYTFDPAPRDVIRPGNGVPRIQSLDDKLAALGAAGIDQVLVEPFDREFAAHTARWFAEEVLGRRLRVTALVLGWDFRFGRGRAGALADLRAWLDVPVEQMDAVRFDDQVVSSSRIRQLVGQGEVGAAARLLGRPHRVHGMVERGDRRGRELGFPTANVASHTPLLPAAGVYAVRATTAGTTYAGVANLGTRPTFGGGKTVLEVHLLDYVGDLYRTEVALDLVARLRPERRFGSAQELTDQISRDVHQARQALAR